MFIYNIVRSSRNSGACRGIASIKKPIIEKKPVLYGDEVSPPVRFVMMTASILGMEIDFHKIDLFKGEHKMEFFKKINPLHKVPALAIENEVICDSHAIVMYLCGRKNNKNIYPTDPLKRARVNQMLFFNSSTLFPIDSAIYTDFFSGKWPADPLKIDQWNSALDYLEYQLNKHIYLAGEKITVCDICCGATVSSLQVLVPASHRHVKVNEWLRRLQDFSCFEINRQGVEKLRSIIERKTDV